MNPLYQQVEKAIRNHTLQMSVPKGTTHDDAHQYIRRVMRENPDIFWFSHQWEYIKDDLMLQFHYTISKERSVKAKKQIDDVIQKDFNIEVVRHLSVLQQVMYVYKWLALYCNYNLYSAYNQTIFSVFVHRNSVCTGFAKAAQYLFSILGVESRLVFGTMHQAEKGSRHCWLLVKIDNQWYHHDPTFAVPEISNLLYKAGVVPVYGAEGLVYNYFCCDTQSIKQSRIIEDENELPICTSTIESESLQDIPIHLHRTEGAEQLGVRGCLLSDKGSYSDVYLWHSDKITQSVVKIYKNDIAHELLRHELRIMRQLSPSNHVLHVLGITDNQDGLIIEQATSLADLLCSHYYQLSAMNFCKLLLNVIDGLQDSIKYGIYYRDIHLNNIYRTSKGCYVLGDFGSCIWIDSENSSNVGGVGSPWYSAPETYLNGVFNERSATYGVGMLAFFLLNELLPPLWNEYRKESQNLRVHGHELPSPLLLKKPSCAFEQQMASIIKKSLSFELADRYQKLSDLERALKQCMSLVKDGDYLLIEGGASERVDKFDKKENIDRKTYHDHTDFHSTFNGIPEILVSNGDNESLVFVDTNDDCQADIMQYDMNSNEAISDDEIVDLANSSIDDFAYTAGNPFDYSNFTDELYDDSSIPAPPPGSTYEEFSQRAERIDDFAATSYNPRHIPAPPPSSSSYEKGSHLSDINRKGCPNSNISSTLNAYLPEFGNDSSSKAKSKKSIWSRIFRKKEEKIKEDEVYGSVFAPQEVKPNSHLLVQVFLHLLEEADKVQKYAMEADSKAERRKFAPLKTNLKSGDNVKVELNLYGESLLFNATNEMTWRGHFTQCDFDYFVSSDIDVNDLSCEVNLYVNGAIIGNMSFITKIVAAPRKLNSEIKSRVFKRIFISYAHQDSKRAKDFALAYKAQGTDYFYDRDKLAAGDVYEEKIFEYIDSADLFILCWSENASRSEYVWKELKRAMLHAYPQLSMNDATLKIYPISIEPRTSLPEDMAGIYNFEEV